MVSYAEFKLENVQVKMYAQLSVALNSCICCMLAEVLCLNNASRKKLDSF